MILSAAEIEKLCDDWCAASKNQSSGMTLGKDTEKYRLLANGVVFHELDFASLCAALTGTARVLLRPRLCMVVDDDHLALWAWCAELLLCPQSQFFSLDQIEIKSLFETSVHAALANCRRMPPKPASREEWIEQHRISERQPHHAKYFVENAYLTLAYLGFPLLEAMTKRACSAYVAFDGRVTSDSLCSGKERKKKKIWRK